MLFTGGVENGKCDTNFLKGLWRTIKCKVYICTQQTVELIIENKWVNMMYYKVRTDFIVMLHKYSANLDKEGDKVDRDNYWYIYLVLKSNFEKAPL